MNTYINNYINDSIKTKEAILDDKELIESIEGAAKLIIEAYRNSGKILLAGNGGSAADSQHLAAELVSKFLYNREALPAIALTTNTSILTSVGNDYSHEYIFSRQIQAYGNSGDVFVAISTSGNSQNILNAIDEAKKRNLKIIGLTGIVPNKMEKLCDIVIKVPAEKTPIIQESHIMIGHIICALVEKELFEHSTK